MFPLLISILISTSIGGNSPEYDYNYSPAGGDFGECKFTGRIQTGGPSGGGDACKQCDLTRTDFKQGGDLTWKILLSVCPNLIYGECTDEEDYEMEDLVWWRNSCNWGCPRCPCEQGDDKAYYIHNYTSFSIPFETKICYECSCEHWFTDDDDNDVFARECDEESRFDSPSELEESNIQCPDMTSSPTPSPTGACLVPAPGGAVMLEYDIGDTYFYDDGVDCKYCRCNSTYGSECENFANVTDNEDLKYTFLDDCNTELADCWNTTDKSITEQWVLNYGNCGCPYCDCYPYPAGGNDRWKDLQWNSAVYNSDNGEFDYALYDCVECRCTAANDVTFNIDRRTCTTYDGEERAAEDCTESSDLLECMEENDGDVPSGTNDVNTCWDDTYDTYCGFHKIDMIAAQDPDVVCVEEDIEDAGTWGCFQNYVCEAIFDKTTLNDDGMLCLYNENAEFTVKSYDCIKYEWLSETYKVNLNFSCCTTDQCNDQSVWEDCESNSVATDVLKVTMGCESNSDHGVSNSDFIKSKKCGKDLPQDKYSVCDIIGDYWKWETACDCRYYQVLEKNMANDAESKELKQALQLTFDEEYASTKYNLEVWNDAYECNKKFECDITDGIGSKKLNILSIISVIFVFMMF